MGLVDRVTPIAPQGVLARIEGESGRGGNSGEDVESMSIYL